MSWKFIPVETWKFVPVETGKVVQALLGMVRTSCDGEGRTTNQTRFVPPAYTSSFSQLLLSFVPVASMSADHEFSFAPQGVF